MNEKKNKTISVIQIALMIVFAIAMMISLFYRLDYHAIQSTDEACYGANSYEMLKSGDYIVNTLKYTIDYFNSKPPLLLWCQVLSYKTFGVGPFALRFPSAVAGVIIYSLCIAFCWKKWGRTAALWFSAYMPACLQIINFHMFRAGDADAIYTLFFLLAIYFMYMAENKPVKNMLLVGLFGGLAFMTKGPHAAMIAAICVCYYPWIREKVKIKHYFMALATAIAVITPWAIARYMRDGRDFFYIMIFDESVDRVRRSSFSLDYFKQILTEPVCIFCILLGIVQLIIFLRNREKDNQTKTSFIDKIKLIGKDNYLMLTWIFIIVIGYFMARQRCSWYIYSVYFPIGFIGARAWVCIFNRANIKLEQGKKLFYALSSCIMMALLVASIVIVYKNVNKRPGDIGDGGSRNGQLRSQLEWLRDNSDESFSGRVAYIEDPRNDYKFRAGWELDTNFYGETILDLICLDGGVLEFVYTDDQEAILIMHDSLWDEYADLLTGYVFLDMNNYYIMCKRRYGE